MAEPPGSSERVDVPSPIQPRFGLGMLLLVMLVLSVSAASAYYLVQAVRGERSFQLVFIVFTLAAPLLLLVIVATAGGVLRWLGRKRG